MDGIAPLHKALRDRFPTLRQERVAALPLLFDIPEPAPPEVVWRFLDHAETTQISISPSFLAVDTRDYSDRDTFISLLRDVLDVLVEYERPEICDRLGVRFVNRLAGSEALQVRAFVRAEVRGELPVPDDDEGKLAHSLSLMVYAVPEGFMQIRFGAVPAGATVDPTVEALDDPSWLLDLDIFSSAPMEFSVEEIEAQARRAAIRSYKFFLWAMTDDFLDYAGAKA